MRLTVAVTTLVLTLAVAGEVTAQTELRASVDLSEWTPSQSLTLNLMTGKYVVTPPVRGWPKTIPLPPARRGRLSGENLRVARTLAKQAYKTGLVNKDCEARKGVNYPFAASNAVGPMELTVVDDHAAQTSVRSRCRTKDAEALFSYVSRLFDHRSP